MSSSLRRITLFALLLGGAATAFVACGGDGDEGSDPTGGGLSKAGSGNKAGTSGGSGKGGSAASAGTSVILGGSGGTPSAGGSSGSSAGGNAAGGNTGGGKGGASGNSAGGAPPVDGDTMCFDDTMPPKIVKQCRPATDNECDGMNLPGFKPEGATGNGFDDDCDGLVDEGCECPAAGTTKDCFLLPSTLTNGDPKWEPQGFCAKNGKGKLECKLTGQGEFTKLQYTGQCIGAQPPFGEDVCAKGDFNCDGVEGNAPGGCKCKPSDPVVCPDPLYTTPFPDPNNIGQFSTTPGGPKTVGGVDGHSWIDPKVLDPTKTSNWRWTVVGGPCDDTLPNPTFALFPTKAGTPVVPWATHLGVKTLNLPLVPDKDQPDPTASMTNPKIHKGWILQGANTPFKVFPAFSLSGDYYVTGKFSYPDPNDATKIKEGQCTQVVKVRAPGLRVELCWPEVGPNKDDNDVDLHLARLQGNPAGDGKHGWFLTSGTAPNTDDCYYSPSSACGNRFSPAQLTPGWFSDEITDEPGGVGVCHGWGSRRFDGSVPGTSPRPCTSPRLDRDNIACDPTIEDPNAAEQDIQQQGDVNKNFCGPENINLDAKVLKAGDRFAIGTQCYNCVAGKNGEGAAKPAHPRVNIYCDGELKLGLGYDPAKPPSDPQYPALWTEGQSFFGSFWNAAVVTWNGDPANPCTISPVASGPEWDDNPWRSKSNGSEFSCVHNGPQNKDDANETPVAPAEYLWRFRQDGSYPVAGQADQMCAY